MKKYLMSLVLFCSLFTFLASCKKNGNNGKSTLTVYLTDAPADYSEVNVDIQEVLINNSRNGGEDWISLPIKPGVYNLLKFRNGLDTLLGSIELPAGKISQMRMVLGPNNTLKEGNTLHELTTPSAQQSGLKFKVQVELIEGVDYKLWIDFDAARSIVKAGNSGKYILKPVIKTFTEATSGAIKGIVLPDAAQAWVYAIGAANDTVASAKPQAITGMYLMRGIVPGTYKISIDAANNYKDSVINNINVTLGAVTNAGTVTLTQ
jgi:Domain of unknown function (DUF4382)